MTSKIVILILLLIGPIHIWVWQSLFSTNVVSYIYTSIAFIAVILLVNEKMRRKFRLNKVVYLFLFIQAIIFIKLLLIKATYQHFAVVLVDTIGILLLSQQSGKADFLKKYFFILVGVNILAIIAFFISPSIFTYTLFSGGAKGDSFEFSSFRFTGIFGPPGVASFYFSIMYAFFLNRFFQKSQRTFAYLFFAIFCLGSGLLTGNRSFIVLVGIISLFILSKSFFSFKKITIYVFTIFLIVFVFNDLYQNINLMMTARWEENFDNRLYGGTGSLDILKALNISDILFGSTYFNNGEFWIKVGNGYYQPHNGIIFYLVSYGLLVAIPIVYIYGSGIKNGIRLLKEKSNIDNIFLLIAFIVSLIISLVESFLLLQINFIIIFQLFDHKFIYSSKRITNTTQAIPEHF